MIVFEFISIISVSYVRYLQIRRYYFFFKADKKFSFPAKFFFTAELIGSDSNLPFTFLRHIHIDYATNALSWLQLSSVYCYSYCSKTISTIFSPPLYLINQRNYRHRLHIVCLLWQRGVNTRSLSTLAHNVLLHDTIASINIPLASGVTFKC